MHLLMTFWTRLAKSACDVSSAVRSRYRYDYCPKERNAFLLCTEGPCQYSNFIDGTCYLITGERFNRFSDRGRMMEQPAYVAYLRFLLSECHAIMAELHV